MAGGTVAIAFKPQHLKRYRDIARLLLKYGRSGIAVEPDALAQVAADQPTEQQGEELADDLESMGPVFIKLGQVLSSRSDLLPPAYLKALSRLQDKLEPFPFDEARQTIEEELGVRLSKAFLEFDEKPIATASLGQVYRAALRSGREVVVKVQRPAIRKQIAEDMDALEEIAGIVDSYTDVGRRFQFGEILDEFRKNLIRELDYRKEAHSMTEIGHNLRDFKRIVVPAAVEDYTSQRVLTMDYVRGRKVTDLGPLAHLELPGAELAEDLFRAYLKQIMIDGLFHADPHPGNVLVTYDDRIGLIDLGMVGRVTPAMQERLLKLLIALGESRSDEVADLALEIGEVQQDFDERDFRRRLAALVEETRSVTVEDLQIGQVMLDFSKASGESGIRMPSELTMLSKALLNLDGIGRALDPRFNPNEAIRRHVGEIARERMLKSVSSGSALSALIETKEFVEALPGRVNRILDNLAGNKMRFEVQAIDEATLIQGFQKVANRIATGLVLAALIIGAAMLMRVETSFRLFGYPGLAMLCFLLAAGGGIWLILTILLTDKDTKRS